MTDENEVNFTERLSVKRRAVKIKFLDGSELPGYLYLHKRQRRVQDLLNERSDRMFLPFVDSAGEMRLISRYNIAQVIDDGGK